MSRAIRIRSPNALKAESGRHTRIMAYHAVTSCHEVAGRPVPAAMSWLLQPATCQSGAGYGWNADGKANRARPTGPARPRRPSPKRANSTLRWNRQPTTSGSAALTVFGPGAPPVSGGRRPCRCWRRTCTGSGLSSSAGGTSGSSVSENGRPDPANPLEIDVKLRPAGPGTAEPCPWRRIPVPNRGGASRNRGNRPCGTRPAPQRTGSCSSETGNTAVLHRQCLIQAKRGSGSGQSTADTMVPCSDHASLRCAVLLDSLDDGQAIADQGRHNPFAPACQAIRTRIPTGTALRPAPGPAAQLPEWTGQPVRPRLPPEVSRRHPKSASPPPAERARPQGS